MIFSKRNGSLRRTGASIAELAAFVERGISVQRRDQQTASFDDVRHDLVYIRTCLNGNGNKGSELATLRQTQRQEIDRLLGLMNDRQSPNVSG